MAPKELGEYGRKRDFEATPEPAPRRGSRREGAPRFVVQEHDARRLHWDLARVVGDAVGHGPGNRGAAVLEAQPPASSIRSWSPRSSTAR